MQKSVKWDLTNPHNPHPVISYKALIPNMKDLPLSK